MSKSVCKVLRNVGNYEYINENTSNLDEEGSSFSKIWQVKGSGSTNRYCDDCATQIVHVIR